MTREEPLLKQLVRSRAALQPRDPFQSAPPMIRSSSQPPSIHRVQQQQQQQLLQPQQLQQRLNHNNQVYTVQFLPYAFVFPSTQNPNLSISQPDLTRLYTQSPPVTFSSPPSTPRCLSPIPISPNVSPLSSSPPVLLSNRQPDLVNSIPNLSQSPPFPAPAAGCAQCLTQSPESPKFEKKATSVSPAMDNR